MTEVEQTIADEDPISKAKRERQERRERFQLLESAIRDRRVNGRVGEISADDNPGNGSVGGI